LVLHLLLLPLLLCFLLLPLLSCLVDGEGDGDLELPGQHACCEEGNKHSTSY